MNYWLFKSEPSTFSIDALAKLPDQTTRWDGVRNYQARNFMRQMKVGDQAFFYHSSCEVPGIVGTVSVVKEAYPEDPNDPRWSVVEVKLIKKLLKIISLTELRTYPELKNMIILRAGNRLSVTPVTSQEWQRINA